MARPSKNNCDYFPHDNDMRNHVKVKAIRNKFKNGYAIWVMFLEYLTSADGNVFEYTDLQFELLSGDFGFNSNEIKEVIDYALKLEMVFNRNGFVNSDSLDVRLEPVYLKRGKSKEQSAKQKRTNGQFVGNNSVDTVVSVTEMPQSKVNKSKVKNMDAAKAATLKRISDFKESLYPYTKAKGGLYDNDTVKEFFNYWSELNKSQTKMLWELKPTFEISKRLATWVKNEDKFSKNGKTEQANDHTY